MPIWKRPKVVEELLATHNLRWHERAACKGREELFLQDNLKYGRKAIEQAKEICQTCPVNPECKDWSSTITNWSAVVIGGVYYGVNGKRYE